VFLTTHSTNFLDTGAFDHVFMISKERSTLVSSLTLTEAEEKLPEELGMRLSSLFMYDQIIFVEGPSDEQIIREFASTLNINLGQLNAGFITMSGVRNIGHYAAAEVITFLTKRKVKLCFVVDADESGSVHFTRIQDRFKDVIAIHRLSKREIENYILLPRAIAEHLLERKRGMQNASFEPPTEQDVRSGLLAAADELKWLAIWKRVSATACCPIIPPNVRRVEVKDVTAMKAKGLEALRKARDELEQVEQGFDETISHAVSDVERNWEAKKLDIVPGASLLDHLYKRYGLRFEKTRDGPAVAALMRKDEIDREIVKVISAWSE
jgi:putative ATP-dependent endonuclease of OLD family